MFALPLKNPNSPRRLIGAAMLLFVFFLPLHFHSAAATAQVAKECSCVHGTRIEAGPAPASTTWTLVLTAHPIQSESFDWSSYVHFHNHGIRAPPFAASL